MHFTTDPRRDDGVIEQHFAIGEVPGVLWMPTNFSGPVPLILQGHPGGIGAMRARLATRAHQAAANGFASATIELPGGGDRPRVTALDDARRDLQAALAAGVAVPADVIDRLVLPLVDQSVPEWQATIDALLALPDIDGPVGYSGGVIAIGVRLARVEPRVAAVGLFAGSFVPRSIVDEAREVTIPVHVLLQWDDLANDRQAALDLFDALGSSEKSLHAHMGGHTGLPAHAGESATKFFTRHLVRDEKRGDGAR